MVSNKKTLFPEELINYKNNLLINFYFFLNYLFNFYKTARFLKECGVLRRFKIYNFRRFGYMRAHLTIDESEKLKNKKIHELKIQF